MPTFDHDRYAATLAWAVEWLRRSPTPGPPQKAALRALLDLAETTSATIRFYENKLTVDDTSVSPEAHQVVSKLIELFRSHAVLEISIARGAEAPELLALTRGLAAPAGQGRLKERLRDAGSSRVMVILEQPHELHGGRRRQVSFTQAFAKASLDQVVMDEWNKFLSSRTEHSEPARSFDLGFGEGAGAAAATADAAAQPAAPSQTSAPSAPSAPPQPPSAPSAPPQQQAPQEPPPPLQPRHTLPQPATLQAATPLGIALANVLRDPYGKEILQRMSGFGKRAEEAFAKEQVAEVLDALQSIIELEAKAPPEVRNAYDVVLRRVLTRASLAMVVPYVQEPRRADRAAVVLRRGGEDAVNLLLGLLATAPTLTERLEYVKVLRSIPKGVDRVLGMLTRSEWQVVRNVAELIGEAGIEQGANLLGRLIEHSDQRVQRAAIVALARLGAASTVEPLRRLLKEGAPELRALIAGSIGGAQAKSLVPMLVAAADAEDKPELVRDYWKALGRIGTGEAVAALAKAAGPGGKLLGRKSAAARLAAIEGLRLAGDAALPALQALADDGDKSVREAVRAALDAVQARSPAPR